MERELFEHIVMSVCKSEDKTKQVMDIVYGKLKYLKCDKGHYYVDTNECCPYCSGSEEKVVGSFKRCKEGHFYKKHLHSCPYCKDENKCKPSSKKQELIESLEYLKNKEHKTDKDRESISVIQAILNGMQ